MLHESTESALAAPETPQAAADIAEPVEPGTSPTYLGGRPLRRFIFWFSLAAVGISSVWASVGNILLPNQVQSIEFGRFFSGADASVDLAALTSLRDAVASGTAVATVEQRRLLGLLEQFDAARVQSLALVMSFGVVASMLVQPIVGVFSDRTRSRLGRRAPWLLLGGLGCGLFLALMPLAPSVVVLALLWSCTQGMLSIASAPLNTTVADRIAENKLGTVSSLGGLGNFIGGIFGVILAGSVFALLGLNTYLILATFVVLVVVGFVLQTLDRPSTMLQVPPFSWREFWLGFLVPLRSSDFRLVWIARIALFFGWGASSALNFFMLQSYISPPLSAAEATATVPTLGIAGVPATLLAVVLAGRLSDKLGRRKPFVIGAALLMALAFLVPLLSPTLTGMYIQSVLTGFAFGIYIPVNQALFIDVLPDKNAAGRDLGIAGISTSIGQFLASIVAGQVVALTGGYAMVWVVALVLVLVSTIVIVPVKSVR